MIVNVHENVEGLEYDFPLDVRNVNTKGTLCIKLVINENDDIDKIKKQLRIGMMDYIEKEYNLEECIIAFNYKKIDLESAPITEYCLACNVYVGVT